MKKLRMEPQVSWRFDGNLCYNGGQITSLKTENDKGRWLASSIVVTRNGKFGNLRLNMTESWVECKNVHYPSVDPQLHNRLDPLVTAGIFTKWERFGNGLFLEFQLQSGISFCQTAVRNGVILITALGMGDSALRSPEVVFVPQYRRKGSKFDEPWGEELRDQYTNEFYFDSHLKHPELFPRHPLR